MNLGTVTYTLASGQKRRYFVLQQVRYDPAKKRGRTHFLAYIGDSTVLSEDRARQIATEIGCTLADLCRVRGLTVELKQTPEQRERFTKAAEYLSKLTEAERQTLFKSVPSKPSRMRLVQRGKPKLRMEARSRTKRSL